MSMAVLAQVYDEMRRLAIAGSVVAGGDFRLKKLVAPLEQAGAKAPIFAKVAQAVSAVVESKEQNSAEALLELTTLINAILYTQGETGLAGEIRPIETTEMGEGTQATARVIKPLLEALTSTGSGRLEQIRDAIDRGFFRDMRLVKASVAAIDDPYPEIGELICKKVLPMYGKAIVPDLLASFQMKGKQGHARRLALLHTLDGANTRPLVKQALDDGSKEVRIAAIGCLGDSEEDLAFVIEQSKAKSQEVRSAAYHSLSRSTDAKARTVLKDALAGKDLELVVRPLRETKDDQLNAFVITQAESELQSLGKGKDKKAVGTTIHRLISLLQCMELRRDPPAEKFMLDVFADREQLAGIKGETNSGKEINESIVFLMSYGTAKTQQTLIEARDSLTGHSFAAAFGAGLRSLPPKKAFELFSPYLAAAEKKKKKKGAASDGSPAESIIEVLTGTHWQNPLERRTDFDRSKIDPRWLDTAVAIEQMELVQELARPGHEGASRFLEKAFAEALKSSKDLFDSYSILKALINVEHPKATEFVIDVIKKHGKKAHSYWLSSLIPDLPKAALPKLEALIPTLDDKVANQLIDAIQELRNKP